MKRSLLTFTLIAGTALGAMYTPATYSSMAAVKEKSGGIISEHVTITRGKSHVIKVADEIADVLVADPSVIEVGAIKSDKLYLIGASLGDTNITIFDADGNTIDQMDIHVRVDEATLQATLDKLFPEDQIIAKTVNDDIMLTGVASNPAVAGRIEEVASRFAGGDESVVNMMTVTGEQQVMLKVKVMEISRSILNELGVDVDALYAGNDLTTNLLTDQVGLTATNFLLEGASVGTIGEFQIGAFFSALERDGYASTLAEPNLTAISGENARFLAGGEFPVVVGVDTDDDGSRDITYDYRPIGVALAFKPVVLDKDRINLNISTEVSNISNDLFLELTGITIPGFDVRRAETSVEIPSGGTLMLAGLIESTTLRTMNRIPGVKNIPIIGDLVNSESFQRNETELVVLISSYLVNPFEETVAAAEAKPAFQSSPLSNAFFRNLQNQYGDATITTLTQGMPVGYIVD